MVRKKALLILVLALAAARGAQAAVFTVGPGGTHAAIQAAIDAAVAAGPGFHEVRVAQGEYHERLAVDLTGLAAPGLLWITGGWSAGFATQSLDPALTVVDADGLGRVLEVDCARVEIEVALFTLREGLLAGGAGAGADLRANGCTIVLRRNRLLQNEIKATDPLLDAVGAGLSVMAVAESVVELTDNLISGNTAQHAAADGVALDAGLRAILFSRSSLSMTGNTIEENRAEGPSRIHTAGASVVLHGFARATVLDNTFRRNIVERLESPPGGTSGFVLTGQPTCVDCRAEARRNRVIDNFGSQFQFHANLLANGVFAISDSLVADSIEDGGAWLLVLHEQARIQVTNLTVAGNEGSGIRAELEMGFLSVANTISFGNGAPDTFDPGVVVDSLFSSNPVFLNPAAGDYHLTSHSPAIDAGNNSPIGGLGPFDLDRAPRLQGTAVDIGAYETDRAPGAPGLCRVRDVGTIPFIPDWAPACRCLRDDVLRSLRCGGLGPGLFLEVMVPLPLVAGQPIEARWTLHPWTGAAEGSYQLAASLLVGQKEELVSLQGKGVGKISGKDVHETFELVTPFAPATLRTLLELSPAGTNASHQIEMDVLLEPPPPQDPI